VSPKAPPSLRRPHTEGAGAHDLEVRERLLGAGRKVFGELGYAGARVEDIIEAAGTSRATFYRYFKSKNALFVELSRLCFQDMRGVTRAIAEVTPGDDARSQLVALLEEWQQLLARHGGVIRAWLERDAVPDPPIRREAKKAFDRLFEELLGPISLAGTSSQVPPEVQAAVLFVLIDRSYLYATSRHSHVNPERLAPTLAAMIERSYLGGAAAAPRRRLRIAGD
jgi:AcrR family transcriptional regulator